MSALRLIPRGSNEPVATFLFQDFFLRNKVIRTNSLMSDFRERNHQINYRKPIKADRCPLLAFFFLKGKKIFLPTNR